MFTPVADSAITRHDIWQQHLVIDDLECFSLALDLQVEGCLDDDAASVSHVLAKNTSSGSLAYGEIPRALHWDCEADMGLAEGWRGWGGWKKHVRAVVVLARGARFARIRALPSFPPSVSLDITLSRQLHLIFKQSNSACLPQPHTPCLFRPRLILRLRPDPRPDPRLQSRQGKSVPPHVSNQTAAGTPKAAHLIPHPH
jgi:hypothetical protein